MTSRSFLQGNKNQDFDKEDKFKKIFESIIDVYYRTDNQGIITMVSPSVYKVTGYKPEEIVGTKITKYFKDQMKVEAFLDRILETERILNNEDEVLTKAGSSVIVSANVRKLVDRQGQFLGVEGVFRDITERKLAETALRESEERYRMLSNLTFEGIIIHDHGKILDCNEAFLHLLKCSRKEILGKNIVNLAVPDKWKTVVKEKIMEGANEPYYIEGIDQSGDLIPVEIESREINYRKIKARVSAIRDLRQSIKAREDLRTANNMLEAILNTIPVRVFWKDRESRYLGCNAMVAKDANLNSPSEIIGKYDDQLPWSKEAQKYREDDVKVLGNNKPKLNYEESLIDWEGNMKHIKTSKIPLKDPDGIVIGTLGCWEDITEQRERQQTLEENARRLERTNHELDNFVYRVSHDLKSPISSVKGLVHIARLESDPARQLECLDMIENSMDNLDKFIVEILDYSRNARLGLSIEPINLKELLLEIFDQHKFIDSQGVPELKVNMNPNQDIHSDKRRLSYIFNNLISNSLKFSDPEKSTLTIDVDIAISASEVAIIYADNGLGIEGEHLNHIFDMFYRASEGKPGSGLGLYILKEAIVKLNGNISVQSEPGVGTQFTIRIPNVVD